MNAIKKIISGILHDKKKLIIAIAVIAVAVFLLMPRGNNTSAGFGSDLATVINNDSYSANGSLTLCNYNFDLNLSRSGSDYQFGVSNEDVSYQQLLTKSNNNLYLNYSLFENNGGIATVKCAASAATDEDNTPVTLKQVIIDSLNSQYLAYTTSENYYEAKLTSENWKNFWSEAATNLKDNKESILQNYSDTSVMSDELNIIIQDLEKLSTSENAGNYMTLTLSQDEDENYLFTIDSSIDFNVLPDFISVDSFDANQFTIYATVTYSFTANAVGTPSGYVYSIGNDTIDHFVTNCWNSIFGKKAYTAFNEVTLKSDSVTNVINLGDTSETYQYSFDKDGCDEGVVVVTSYDRNRVEEYKEKYASSMSDDDIIYNASAGVYSISISLSDSAINSINKISTTPNGLATYLKSSEGVIPIV